ncbi:MAG: DUF3800 domain-containing protein [Lachnospiraceae bacterium]|nr:DUF3800 domain-containing protein [Lachnospiraceae bacterium]
MILYVDETENDEYFIVTGLLIASKETAMSAYKHFKKKIENIPISSNDKMKVFTEFKATLLDRKYQRIKVRMLEELNDLNHLIIYSCYVKKGVGFPQAFKEDTYITLLAKIVSSIEEDISIVFDTFNKRDFEEKIVDRISSYNHVQAIMSRDSQKEPGLQFVDNLCSIMRMHKSGSDENNFYSLIENCVREV